MCLEDCDRNNQRGVSRRAFLVGTGAVVAGAAIGLRARVKSQVPPTRALDDPEVFHEAVTFENGPDRIDGYLARPMKEGLYPPVLILHGNIGIPEDHQNTAARLAQSGYVGLVVSSTSREGLVADLTDPNAKSVQPDPSLVEFAYSYRFIRRYIGDAQSGIEYLRTLAFVEARRAGLVGFCGGGITALIYAATAGCDLEAVVTFYAAPKDYPPHVSSTDPRPDRISLVDQIEVPLQCHFGSNDGLIPVKDVRAFEQALQKQNVKAEVYVYEGAGHAFYDYTRPEVYNPEAAKLAGERMLTFLNTHFK